MQGCQQRGCLVTGSGLCAAWRTDGREKVCCTAKSQAVPFEATTPPVQTHLSSSAMMQPMLHTSTGVLYLR